MASRHLKIVGPGFVPFKRDELLEIWPTEVGQFNPADTSPGTGEFYPHTSKGVAEAMLLDMAVEQGEATAHVIFGQRYWLLKPTEGIVRLVWLTGDRKHVRPFKSKGKAMSWARQSLGTGRTK